ncbi:MAG: YciI family protein [Acidimicrobiia bacterium]
MLIIYGNDEIWTSFPADEFAEVIRRTDAHNAALAASGEMLGAYGVGDQVQTKQVTVADGAVVVTDGPYIEAKEYIGSFYIVDVDSEARALEIAAEMPSAKFRQIEVRPILHEAPDNCETP